MGKVKLSKFSAEVLSRLQYEIGLMSQAELEKFAAQVKELLAGLQGRSSDLRSMNVHTQTCTHPEQTFCRDCSRYGDDCDGKEGAE